MQSLARTPGQLERLMAELEAESGDKPEATAQQVREFFLNWKYRIEVNPIVSLQIVLSQAPQLTQILAHTVRFDQRLNRSRYAPGEIPNER